MKAEKKAAAAACAAFAPESDPKPQAFPVHQLFSTTLDIPTRGPQTPSLVLVPKLGTTGTASPVQRESEEATSRGGLSC